MPDLTVSTAEMAALWNRSAPGHPLTYEVLDEMTSADPSFEAGDVLCEFEGDRLVGFALAKRFRRAFLGCEKFQSLGWLALMAVHPEYQRRGLGRKLVGRAEAYLKIQGADRVVLGGSFHHALAGVPERSPARALFANCGYDVGPKLVWDVQRDVRSFVMPDRVGADLAAAGVSGRMVVSRYGMSVEPEATAALLEFMHAEFPGRWTRDVAFALSRGDSPGLVATLEEGYSVVAFAQVHPAGSPGALRWRGFDPEIAAIGPVGVARAHQGKGLGLAIVALATEHLKRMDARRVVIDWTDLLDFYGRLGYQPWLSYVLAQKTL
ncbi:MAG: GNAT family N-acetyltransferase [Candidatus Sericytochromatia bacterium]|uniref:GNAT family N-acetyltransferase n=1 Tax=Candidatus Tanganyikabacteria bacterium TaxID=2961651 RepID=A0A937X3T8_9BACT|nr:GNAT family N-acetyltransferase [Candidatus Tanganyikabacteria bacterium]